MIQTSTRSNVSPSIGIFNCLSSILFLQLIVLIHVFSHINCQRDGRNLSFLSPSSQDETFEARNRAAYIDGSLTRNAERFNSNSQTTKAPSSRSNVPLSSSLSSSSSIISSSSSIVSSSSASAHFEGDVDRDTNSGAGSSSHHFSSSPVKPGQHGQPKILDERQERPEKKERPMKNQRGPTSEDTIEGGLEESGESGTDIGDDEKDVRKTSEGPKGRPQDSPINGPLYSGEIASSSTRPSVKKKSRSTRPPSIVTTTRSIIGSNEHVNTHLSSTQSPLLSTSRPNVEPLASSVPRPGQNNNNNNNGNKFASSSNNMAKAPKDAHPFLTLSHSCGGNITLSSLTTSIVSPGWTEGNKYPANVECVWIISTVRSHFTNKEPSIRVRVKHLEIEQDKVDCPYDYLEFRGYKKLCGFIQNKEILINGSSLVIVFRTDSNYEDRGFDLELYSQVDDCTPEIRASTTGEITSPGFPKNYPDSTDCWTLINANSFINNGGGLTGGSSRSGGVGGGGPENLTISVTFDFIELEPDDQCAYDFVEFFEVDGINKKPTKSLGKFCDDKSINKPDGSADYLPDARVTTSNQPSSSSSLTRHHSSPSPSSSSSLSSSSSFPTRTNGNSKTIQAKGPYLLVHFKSDQLLNLKGFKANYKVEAALSRSSISDCDWIPDEAAMTLSSPQYPKSYPPNKDCSLILKSPHPDQRIVLIFESFLMEIDNNCTFDRLEIYDDYVTDTTVTDSSHSTLTTSNSDNNNNNNKPPNRHGGSIFPSSSLQANGIPMSKEPTKVFCGHKSSKFKYLSGGPVLRLRFVSDSLGEYQGFFARYNYIQSNSDQPPKPAQLFIETPQNASIIPGSSHLLTCHPTNSPANRFQVPDSNGNINHNSNSNSNNHNANNNNNANTRNILWFKDNQLITDGVSENGTKLLIREFSQSDIGRYTCKYGSATAEAWLKVQNTDCRIIFRKRPRDSILSEGEFTIFECNAISPSLLASKVTITWTKNGKKVTNNARVDKLKNGYLVINGVTQEDSGHYFCVVRLEDDPSCASQAGARLDVNVRANVEDICGKPNLALPSKQKPILDSAGKIVGGVDAQKGAFPWQVMFWDVNRKSFCGGALLNERWIATAAHCFTQNKYSPPPPPIDTIVVRLGKFDQKETEDQELNTKIQDIIKHPDYNPETFDNDLALVRVRDHIIFTDYIKPVCIGITKSLIDGIFFTDNHRSIKMGHVTGWGQLKENGPQPRYLQELRMPIVDQETCRKATSFAVTGNMFCAGYAQEIIGDACKGDSGGPFVGISSDRWYLLGIVSWGEGCGRTGKYGYYTKVSNYIDWIKGLIKT